jgi:hypothetical protein
MKVPRDARRARIHSCGFWIAVPTIFHAPGRRSRRDRDGSRGCYRNLRTSRWRIWEMWVHQTPSSGLDQRSIHSSSVTRARQAKIGNVRGTREQPRGLPPPHADRALQEVPWPRAIGRRCVRVLRPRARYLHRRARSLRACASPPRSMRARPRWLARRRRCRATGARARRGPVQEAGGPRPVGVGRSTTCGECATTPEGLHRSDPAGCLRRAAATNALPTGRCS